MSKHQPFRVEITLRTPSCLNRDLTLDAVLAAAMYQLTGDLELAHSKLPLAQTDGVWHASTIDFLAGEHSKQPYVAKLAHSDFDPTGYSGETNRKGRIRINIGGGYLSPQLRKLPTFIGTVAFEGNGDIDQVGELLESLPGLGKNVRQGLGRMAMIEVTGTSQDRSVVSEPGVPARPVPVPVWEAWGNSADSVATDVVGWSPPYWKEEQHVLCAVPTTSG